MKLARRVVWLGALLAAPGATLAQEAGVLRVEPAGGAPYVVPLSAEGGTVSVASSALVVLGWSVQPLPFGAEVRGPAGEVLHMRPGSPFFRRGSGEVLQFSDPPLVTRGELMVPLQLLSDFLPRWHPDRYAFEGTTMTLRVRGPRSTASGSPAASGSSPASRGTGDGVGPARPHATAPAEASEASRPAQEGATALDGPRVVVIDAGHGGSDPGALGPAGIREKTVALGIALAMGEALADAEGIEVHLLRSRDDFIPLWERGARATELKGEQPGVFVSIHANSFPARRSTRGFETYFLSEARTEDERRVAAIENAPLRVETGNGPPEGDLEFILRELRNLDHQHWSQLLAEMVQEEIAEVHPGPSRGVKQGPLAVITNALMPAVLVEIGFLSHPEEARLIGRAEFQQESGAAIAKAVLRFLERYPPGANTGSGDGG